MLDHHDTTVRVRYAETDQMGVVYHSNYLIWMEIGRVEYFRASGLRYRDMERDEGIFLAVAEAGCRYHLPARFDDLITVRTAIREAHSRMVVIGYEIRNENAELLATGFTKHVYLGRDLKPRKLPLQYWPLFGLAAAVKPAP